MSRANADAARVWARIKESLRLVAGAPEYALDEIAVAIIEEALTRPREGEDT